MTENIRSKATLFVRRIPVGSTKDDLKEFFSKAGSIQNCILVDKKRDDAQYQIGFVNFATAKEAQHALTALQGVNFKDQPLIFELAIRQSANSAVKMTWKDIVKQDKRQKRIESKKTDLVENVSKRPEISTSSKMIISGLDVAKISRKHLFKKCKKYGTPVSIIYPYEADGEGNKAFVAFETPKQCMNTMKHIDAHILKGCKLSAVLVLPSESDLASPSIEPKAPVKLCIKNISKEFKTEHDLRPILLEYGKLYKVKLLKDKVDTNPHHGIAIVQYSNPAKAAIALQSLHGKVFHGKAWSVDFHVHREKIVKEESTPAPKPLISAPKEKSSTPDQLPSVVHSWDKKSIFIRYLPLDTTETDIMDRLSKFGKIQYVKLVKSKTTGIFQGTAFVCFKSEESYDACLDCYSNAMTLQKNYASEAPPSLLNSSKSLSSLNNIAPLAPTIIPNSSSNSSSQFEQSPWHIRGRLMDIMPVVDKKQAKELQKKNTNHEQDKRNLYLANIGLLSEEELQAISPDDRKKRLKLHQERTAKLKDLGFFVSKTRLSIRNVPHNLNDSDLKKICKECVKLSGSRSGLIKQVKILKTEKEGKFGPSGILRSMGSAFVEFERHEDAMNCLKIMNNHPTIFGKQDRRPIVDFAIENSHILKKRQERKTALK
jgi:nucleolar protein 4